MNRGLSFVLGSLLIVLVAISGIDMIYTAASGSQKAVLYFAPDTLNVQLGQSFNLSICIANVQDLTGWGLSLSWNSSVIELNPASSRAVAEGSFLKAKASTSFQVPQYNVGTGRLSSIMCTAWPNGVSGNGTLLIICFRAVSFGETSITISGITLSSGSSWSGISYDPPKEGHVTVGSTIHSVAASIECPLKIFVNDSALVNATVVNLGSQDETNVDLSILVNNTPVKNQTGLLRLGSSFSLSYLWTPSLGGAFVVAASAQPVINESRLDDNYVSVSVVVAPKIHDVAVYLACPQRIIVNQTVSLNITAANLGAFDEKGIKSGITIGSTTKDTINDSWLIELGAGSANTSCYPWTPTGLGLYSISVYAYPVIDGNTTNNMQDLSVQVSPAHTDILIVSNEGGSGQQYGTSLKEFKSALDKAGQGYDVWIENWPPSNGSLVSLDLLERYGLVIWTSGDYGSAVMSSFECNILKAYFRNGGNIIFEGERVVYYDYARGFDLPSALLYVKFKGMGLQTTGIASSISNLITNGLTFPITWARTPTYGPDMVVPLRVNLTGDFGITLNEDYGSVEVMHYQGTNYSAVVSVDASNVGYGRVLYYSFSLFCLPSDAQQKLVSGSIDWLNAGAPPPT
jgi:hypothetical protein